MKKIISIFVCMLVFLSSILIIPDDLKVEASGGGGAEEGSVLLDFDYIWEITQKLCNVTYDAYGLGDIPKGRSFGSKGGIYTVDDILKPEMENNIGLDDVHTERLGYINENKKGYSSIINVTDFELTVYTDGGPTYPYTNPIPKEEMFVIATKNGSKDSSDWTTNFILDNVTIIPHNFSKFFPLAGTIDDSISVSNYEFLSDYQSLITGNLTYIDSNDSIPGTDEQWGTVFLFDDIPINQDKLDNLTDAEGAIIIDSGEEGIENVDATNCSFSVVSIDNSSSENVKQLLENYTVLMDNANLIKKKLTFTYNLSAWFSDSPHVYIDRIPKHLELWKSPGPFLRIANIILNLGGIFSDLLEDFTLDTLNWNKPNLLTYLGVVGFKAENVFKRFDPQCKGIFLYDSDNYHYMVSIPSKVYPYYTFNYSVGSFLSNNADTTTISGYSNQEYLEETEESPGAIGDNILGNITIDKSPDDAIAIVSNRYDGMWGQTPGDAGAGGAIVLGIAKYFKDHNITPKYNLTFLFTTAEDHGLRGAKHYNHSHINDNIKYWLILDQLAFDQPDTALCVYYNNSDHQKIIETIINDVQYFERTNYGILPREGNAGGSEQAIPSERGNCDTFCLVKDQDRRWDHWHRTGRNYNEGDCLNNTDRNDVNVTAELTWNITKYFMVNPDCWFNGSVTFTAVDSPYDTDSLNDSINATISVHTSLPHDKVRIKAILKNSSTNDTVFWKNFDFTVDSSGIQKVITVTLPPSCTGTTSGNYKLVLELYNSTGRIDEIIDTGSYDDIDVQNSSVYLYPRGNKKPEKPVDITGPYTLRVFEKGSFTTSTTDDNEDQLQYQWAWRYDKPFWWLYEVEKVGPYDSGENCTVEHWYATRGDKKIVVRAREDFGNLYDGIGEAWSQYCGKYGSWSKWSDPHPVNVKFFINIQMSPTVLASSLNPLSSPVSFPSIQKIDSVYKAVVSGGSEPYSYNWDFGSDKGHTKKIEKYDFPSTGNETVTLTITDNDGYSEVISIDVEVGNLSASYNVSAPSYAEPLEKIIFNDTSAVYTDYHITNWTWNFDDGAICYDQHTNHTYESLGAYNVTLTVTDNQSGTDVYYKIITVACDYNPPVINYSSHEFIDFGNGFDISICGEFEDDVSGIKSASVNITYPDNTSGNYTMNHFVNDTFIYIFNNTWQMEQYNYTLWAVDNANNSVCSTGHGFTIKHVFGYSLSGSLNQSIEDRITGSVFTINKNGTADNISAYIQTNLSTPPKTKCMVYKKSDSTLIGTTEELTPTTGENASWVVFNFTGTKPTLVKDTEYVLTCWSNDTCYLYYDNVSETKGRYKNLTYGSPPNPVNWTGNEKRLYSICCAYTTAPEITNVSATPDPVGFGFNVTISANVNDNGCGIDVVKVNISYPNNNTGNFTMSNTAGDTYQYIFNDTWVVGQYNYSIWARDNYNTSSFSSGHSFNVSVNATISVCTIKDSYGNNETINLTDPPPADPPLVGYELLDDGDVLHMWNEHNSYYFNTSSGIQLTNHYDEYWSHNVLMLGYYNNDKWNLIYRTDELSGFNKDIDTDNETFVNATLWKDLTYKGYDFRLAIRYHLGADDPDLTVIPYIKNLGEAIPYTLAFGWEIKDIKIANTFENDTIRLFNGTDWISYNLNQTLDNRYTNMDYNTTFYLEGLNEGKYFRRTLYLKWNHTLDYLLRVKSRDGQYNAPVTLFIKVGTLAEDQEKYTKLNWLDSDSWLGVNGRNYHSCCGYEGPFGPSSALDGIDVWLHLCTEDHWLIIDLKQMYNIKKVRGRSDTGNDPTSVDIYISDDSSNWGSAVHTGITTWQDTSNWAEVDITDTIGRYINISITSTEGGAGSDYLEFGGIPIPMTIFDVYGEPLSDVTYYFNSLTSEGSENTWETSPTYMIDGSTSTFASTTIGNDIEGCTGNTCSDGTNLGSIFKVKLRAHGNYSNNQRDIILVPVFGGSLRGSEYNYETTSTAGWSQWFDITDDILAPSNWVWADIATLDCDVISEQGVGGPFTLYCSKVEIRVTYDPAPEISDPFPVDGSMGISFTPTLNITVSDAYGESMNITWLSNSSGSWQTFGTNNSVNNGTYRQVFSNATENGKWWYWRVNVSDNTSYNVSSVFKFYTGNQSKIKIIGTTNIKGYLLIQVQYYNNSSTWIVADDTINETTPRTVNAGQQIALDTIFNGLVNTSNLSSYGNGTYRIYAAFRDPEGNILVTDDETQLVATYEFDITFD